MNNIIPFSPQEIIETEASEWLVRLDGDEAPTDEELSSLKEWINQSSAHRDQLLRLARHWDNANILTELSDPKYYKHERKNGFYSWLTSPHGNWRGSWQGATAVMSVLFIGVVFGYTLFYENPQSSVAENGRYETRVGEQNTITLADGSIIELNTNSNVQVDYTVTTRSVTLLQGEAHFKVSKDPARPFEVIAGDGKVSAIGTAFAVRLNNEALKVTVTEGKVALTTVRTEPIDYGGRNIEIAESDIEGGVSAGSSISNGNDFLTSNARLGFLEAGQSVIFKPKEDENVEELIEVLAEEAIEQELAWRRGLLLFSGEPLTDVVKEINRYSNVKIEINDPAVSEIRIGGQFKVGETEAMLRVLALNFNVEAQKIDNNTIYLNMGSLEP